LRKIALILLAFGAAFLILGVAVCYYSTTKYIPTIGPMPNSEEEVRLLNEQHGINPDIFRIGLFSTLISLGFFGFFYLAYRKGI
jgi:hypothetical protein